MDLEELKQLEDQFLLCKICEEEVASNGTELHLLPCQHNICGKCIDGIVKKRSRGTAQTLKCPFCRKDFSVPESGKFPTFRYAADLSDALKFYIQNSSIRKEKSVKTLPTNINEEPMLLGKFEYVVPELACFCWGKSGNFYATNYTTDPTRPRGLYCINVLDGAARRFGNLESLYGGAVFMEGELFVYNLTKRYVEVYQNELLVRSWCVRMSRFTPQCFAGMTRDSIGGILIRFHIFSTPHRFILRHYDISGKLVHSAVHLNSSSQAILLLMKYRVLSAYRGSIWLICEGELLWEIPVQYDSKGQIYYKEPIQRCKIAGCTRAREWGEHKIIFSEQTSSSIKCLDLSTLATTNAYSILKRKKRKGKPMLNLITCTKVSTLIADAEIVNADVAASEDGFLAVLGDDAVIKIYKIRPPKAADISPQPLTLSSTVSPGPEYQSTMERIKTFLVNRITEPLQNVYSYLANKLLTVLIVGIILFIYKPAGLVNMFGSLENHLRYFCAKGRLQQSSYGWSNLYLSLCEYQAAIPKNMTDQFGKCGS